VSWSGTDSGSGIAGYDVFVQVNEGAWTLWKADTLDTSGNYMGAAGSTYGFYSIAKDNAGNTEAAPTQADASTFIIPYDDGDINTVDGVNLADAILAAKIICGIDTSGETITLDADINGDDKIGIEEMIYILQYVAGLRTQ
jgi:hypothetical protein